MSPYNDTQHYHSYHVVNLFILLGIMAMGVAYYFLLPDKQTINTFLHKTQINYVSPEQLLSQSQYRLKTAKTKQNKVVALNQLANIYWHDPDPSQYLSTVKQLQILEPKTPHSKKLLDKLLQVWSEDNRLYQDEILSLTIQLEDVELQRQFLVWNQRYQTVLALYDKDYQAGLLTIEQMITVWDIASWQEDEVIKQLWLERLPKQYITDELHIKLVDLYISQKKYHKALAILDKPKTTKDYQLRLFLLEKLKRHSQIVQLYQQAYQQFNKIDYLEKAYFFAKKTGLSE